MNNEIMIYDAIDGWSITPQSIAEKLAQIPKDQTPVVRINSPGGSVFDGIAIYNVLKARGVETIVDGIAASIASIIFLAGSKRTMSEGSVLMIHNPWSFAMGDADAMRKEADILDALKANLVSIYKSNTALEEDEINALLNDETWLNADESIEKGFATEKTDSKMQQVAKFDLTKFAKCPNHLLQPQTEAAQVTEEEHKALLDSALEKQRAEFEARIQEIEAKNEAEKKAEQDRQDKIRASADVTQSALAETLIRNGASVEDALGQLLNDLKGRAPQASQSTNPDLDQFRNGAPLPASNGDSGSVDHKEVFNSIKDPAERARYFEKHKNELKKGA
jgi:ATP-dependent protease ClpP protease subunit